MVERRHRTPGRRESDRVIDSIWRELDVLRDRLERDVDRLEVQLRAFEAGRAAASLARWTKGSIAFGALGVAFGVLKGLGVL